MALRLYVKNLPNAWAAPHFESWVVETLGLPLADVSVFMFRGGDVGADLSSGYIHVSNVDISEGNRLAAMPGCRFFFVFVETRKTP